MDKPRIAEAIVVEGRYDKNALSQVTDAVIIDIGGFAVFNDEQKLALLRRLALARGIVIFTDPDAAGFLIRNRLKSMIGQGRVLHAYAPDVYGREKRKRTGGKEGKLGVEGMAPEVLLDALRRAGATFVGEEAEARGEPITKADLLALGLIGPESAVKRAALLSRLELPEHMSVNALLDVLNLFMPRDDFFSLVREMLSAKNENSCKTEE